MLKTITATLLATLILIGAASARDPYPMYIEDPTSGTAARVGPNGALDINVQDQHTLPLDLYFTKAKGAPTTATSTCVVDCTTMSLTDATNFTDGTYVGIFSGTGRFYFGTQLGDATTSNIITLDTPFDFPFEAGDNVIATTRNMAVDGSTTPQIFQVGSVGTSLDVDVTRILGYIQSDSSMDDGNFGGGDALTKGLFLRQVNGTTNNLWNVKTNGEFALICGTDFNYTTKPPGGTTYGARFRNSYAGQEKHGVTIRLTAGDRLEAWVQDDIADDNTVMYLMLQGHLIQD